MHFYEPESIYFKNQIGTRTIKTIKVPIPDSDSPLTQRITKQIVFV